MAWRHAAPFAKVLDLFKRQSITGEVKQTVQQHRTVPGRQHEAIAVEPFGIGGIVLEEPGPHHIRHRRGAHRQPRVTAIGLLHGVHGEEAQGVDALIVQRRIERHCRRRCVHSNSPFSSSFRRPPIRVKTAVARLGPRGRCISLATSPYALFASFDADAVDVHHLTAEPARHEEQRDADNRKHDGSAQARS